MWLFGVLRDIDLSLPLLDMLGCIISSLTKTILQEPFNMLTILQLMNWISRIYLEIEVQLLSFFWGIAPDACYELELRQAIADLTPTLSPWLSDRLVSHHVPYNVACNWEK
jgi:hypothetical protein